MARENQETRLILCYECTYFCKAIFYLLVYLAAAGLSCGMWDLVPRRGIKPRPPAMGVGSLSHWTAREVP